MEIERRVFLSFVGASSTVAIAGCTGVGSNSSNGLGEAENGRVVDQAPNCGDTQAGGILSITSLGITVYVQNENFANMVRNRIDNQSSKQSPIIVPPSNDSQYYGIEIRNVSDVSSEEAQTNLQEEFGGENIHQVKSGLTLQTARNLGDNLKSSLESTLDLDSSSITLRFVKEDDTTVSGIFAILQEFQMQNLINAGFSLNMTFEGVEGSPELFNESHIEGIRSADDLQRPAMQVQLSSEGQEQFNNAANTAGELENPGEHYITTYVNGEEGMEVMLTEKLAQDIKNGDWDGEIPVSFRSEEAKESALSQPLNLDFDFSSQTSLRFC